MRGKQELRLHELGGGVTVCTGNGHEFGTDAFLLARFSPPRRGEYVCDLGTGCGIIPLLWIRRCAEGKAPFPAALWGVDIQPEAAALFERGLALSNPPFRAASVCGDLRELARGAAPEEIPRGKMHLVTCNPPYYLENSGGLSSLPAARTARHEGDCRIGEVCSAAARLLRFGGRLAVCMPPSRLADAICAMRENGIEPKRLRLAAKDAAAPPRLFLLEGKKGAKPSLQMEPQMNLYENGAESAELAAAYE